MRAVTEPDRYLAIWIPDWPVHAHQRAVAQANREAAALHGVTIPAPTNARHGRSTIDAFTLRSAPSGTAVSDDSPAGPPPLALTHLQRVVAATASARRAGVSIGQRVTDAQALCPELTLAPHRPEADTQQLHLVLHTLEQLVPGVRVVRTGTLLVHSRGPVRYYGSEQRVARVVREHLATLQLPCQVGFANGAFVAQQAAHYAHLNERFQVDPPHPVWSVPATDTVPFLTPLPISAAAPPEVAEFCDSIGVRSLGALRALSRQAVAERCGDPGVVAWHHAHGHDVVAEPATTAFERDATVAAEDAKQRLECATEMAFEVPIHAAEELAFASARGATEFVNAVQRYDMVCTTVQITLTGSNGARSQRSWQHPRFFTPPEILSRLRWQVADEETLRTLFTPPNDETATVWEHPDGHGVVQVQFAVQGWEPLHTHTPKLWSRAANHAFEQRLQRLQSLLGYRAVHTLEHSGGRLFIDRTQQIPWGSSHAASRSRSRSAGAATAADLPWPGQLPDPRPSRVFSPPEHCQLFTHSHRPVNIDDDGLLTDTPVMLVCDTPVARSVRVTHWSAPWPIRERWWRGVPVTHRLQLTGDDGSAWLLLHREHRWYLEGQYD